MTTLLNKIETRTSTGVLSKGWYEMNGETLLVKGNSIDGNKFGYEPYSEVIVSRIGNILGINCLTYNLAESKAFPEIKVKGIKHVSMCQKIELLENEQMVSTYNLIFGLSGMNQSKLTDSFSAIQRAGLFTEELLQMFVLDAFVGNTDRHLNNWEYIIKNNNEIRMSSIIDMGASLLSNISTSDLKFSDGVGVDKAKPFKKTHHEQMKLLKRLGITKIIPRISQSSLMEEIVQRNQDVLTLLGSKRTKYILYYLNNRYEYLEEFM